MCGSSWIFFGSGSEPILAQRFYETIYNDASNNFSNLVLLFMTFRSILRVMQQELGDFLNFLYVKSKIF